MRSRSIITAVIAAAAVLAAAGPAQAFTGAYVRGSSFPTAWRAQSLLIRVACPGGTQSTPRPGDFSFCTGSIRVTYRGRLIALVPFSVRTFDSHVERVIVRQSARRLFRPGRRVSLRWVAVSHDGQGNWAVRAGRITLLNPYSRL
jgi:hypothetical protein